MVQRKQGFGIFLETLNIKLLPNFLQNAALVYIMPTIIPTTQVAQIVVKNS